MWQKIAHFIIRNRILMLVGIGILTLFMGYRAKNVKLSYDFPQVIPLNDPDFINYTNFKKQFGDEGNYIVIGVQSPNLFDLEFFNEWENLKDEIGAIDGVKSAISMTDAIKLVKNRNRKKFEVKKIFNHKPTSQKELDSLVKEINKYPFYKNLFYNEETEATFIAVKLTEKVLASKERSEIIEKILVKSNSFGLKWDTPVHISGLPYIRTRITEKVQKELEIFSMLAIIITSLFLFIFFRSAYAVVFPLLVILIIILTSLGTIDLLGYQITILTSLIPPLIAIIGVPNFIYFLTKYHNEYHKHGNKILAITRMVERIGIVTFMTNITTAIGFGVLFFTDSPILKEFGIVAAINVALTFIVSVIMTPIVFSYLPSPSTKQTKYLNSRVMRGFLDLITIWVIKYRTRIYLVAGIFVILAIIGVTRLKTIGYILDDIPKNDKVYKDLQFFEKHFNGIMPFEIIINTNKEKGLLQPDNLERINRFQDTLASFPEFSRSVSIVDFVKFSRQAFYNGLSSRYGLPTNRERSFLVPYLRNLNDTAHMGRTMVDSNYAIARITTKIEDVGSVKLRAIVNRLKGAAKEIFGDTADVEFTGISVIFLKNNRYLIRSLLFSLALAFILVSLIMGLMFGKMRMIVISLIPNFIPLLITAGMMGFIGIPLKPSTVLVFSIAFGIAVDDALHFLAKYRQELKHHDWDINKTITISLKETGTSMIYTSLVLFFGFAIFYPSSFGGTSSLGMLTSTTLLVAMFTNIIILPSLVITFKATRRRFNKRKRTE